MKRAFTLVEILVAVVVVMVISSGALIYLNNFNSRQKLDKSKDEVVSAIQLAQSYAKGRQLPIGSTETELKYVRLGVSTDGYMIARANGDAIDPYYYKNLVNDGEITVSIAVPPIYFWAGGRLSDSSGTMFGVNQTATVNIVNNGQSGGSYQITINSLGQVSEVKYIE